MAGLIGGIGFWSHSRENMGTCFSYSITMIELEVPLPTVYIYYMDCESKQVLMDVVVVESVSFWDKCSLIKPYVVDPTNSVQIELYNLGYCSSDPCPQVPVPAGYLMRLLSMNDQEFHFVYDVIPGSVTNRGLARVPISPGANGGFKITLDSPLRNPIHVHPDYRPGGARSVYVVYDSGVWDPNGTNYIIERFDEDSSCSPAESMTLGPESWQLPSYRNLLVEEGGGKYLFYMDPYTNQVYRRELVGGAFINKTLVWDLVGPTASLPSFDEIDGISPMVYSDGSIYQLIVAKASIIDYYMCLGRIDAFTGVAVWGSWIFVGSGTRGGGIVHSAGTDGTNLYFLGNNNVNFRAFNKDLSEITGRAQPPFDPPFLPAREARLVHREGNLYYHNRGSATEVYKYTISTDSWSTL